MRRAVSTVGLLFITSLVVACGDSGGAVCGNGSIEEGEVCDGSNLDGRTCKSLEEGRGSLACADDCQSWDTSSCEADCKPACAGRECGPDPRCGESCGTCSESEACTDAGTCEATCEFEPVSGDRTYDIDLTTASVSASITLDGEPMPDNGEDETRGWLRFVDTESRHYRQFSIGAEGAARLDGELYEGTYDVRFISNRESSQDVVPYQEIVLAEDVVIEDGDRLAYDLETVTVEGTISLDGESSLRGRATVLGFVNFVDRTANTTVRAQIVTGDVVDYEAELFAGTYEVRLSPRVREAQRILPPYDRVLADSVDLTEDRTLDYDVSTFTVDGEVKLRGEALPDSGAMYGQIRGYLKFTHLTSRDDVRVSVGETGAARYETELYPGVYRVEVVSPRGQEVLPKHDHVVADQFTVDSETTRSFDLGMATVEGTVTVDGEQMPEAGDAGDRPGVVFVDRTTGDRKWFPLSPEGTAIYEAKLFPGKYDVELVPANFHHEALPEVEWQLAEKLSVSSGDQSHDFDVQTVEVEGEVTLNGETMPTNTFPQQSRGEIHFGARDTSGFVEMGLGAEGPAAFEGKLYAGSYDVRLHPKQRRQSVLPHINVPLATDVSVEAPRQFDYNVDTAKITGEVTVDGEPVPENDAGASRGKVWFEPVRSADAVVADIPSVGKADYQVRVFQGSYDAVFKPADDDVQTVIPPIAQSVGSGCVPASACDRSSDDLSGHWSVYTTMNRWPSGELWVGAENGTYRGWYSESGDKWKILNADRQGEWWRFDIFGDTRLLGRAELVNGCFMQGSFVAKPSAPFGRGRFTHWRAFRTSRGR